MPRKRRAVTISTGKPRPRKRAMAAVKRQPHLKLAGYDTDEDISFVAAAAPSSSAPGSKACPIDLDSDEDVRGDESPDSDNRPLLAPVATQPLPAERTASPTPSFTFDSPEQHPLSPPAIVVPSTSSASSGPPGWISTPAASNGANVSNSSAAIISSSSSSTSSSSSSSASSSSSSTIIALAAMSSSASSSSALSQPAAPAPASSPSGIEALASAAASADQEERKEGKEEKETDTKSIHHAMLALGRSFRHVVSLQSTIDRTFTELQQAAASGDQQDMVLALQRAQLKLQDVRYEISNAQMDASNAMYRLEHPASAGARVMPFVPGELHQVDQTSAVQAFRQCAIVLSDAMTGLLRDREFLPPPMQDRFFSDFLVPRAILSAYAVMDQLYELSDAVKASAIPSASSTSSASSSSSSSTASSTSSASSSSTSSSSTSAGPSSLRRRIAQNPVPYGHPARMEAEEAIVRGEIASGGFQLGYSLHELHHTVVRQMAVAQTEEEKTRLLAESESILKDVSIAKQQQERNAACLAEAIDSLAKRVASHPT